MFYIVEQNSKLESLQRLSKLGLYVDVISSNDLYHPKLTSTIAVYIRPVNSKHGFIIPINHDEGLNVSKERVYGILSSASKLYTVNNPHHMEQVAQYQLPNIQELIGETPEQEDTLVNHLTAKQHLAYFDCLLDYL